MKKLIIACLAAGVTLLAGCGLHIYQPNIQQGNLMSAEMMDQIRPGMSKAQVENILGEPILVNTFDANHSAYVYTFQKNGGTIERKNVEVYFSNNHVTRVQKSVGTIS